MIDFINFNNAIQTLKNQVDALHKSDTKEQIVDIMEDIDSTIKILWQYIEEDNSDKPQIRVWNGDQIIE